MEAENGAQLFTTLALMFGGALLAGCAPFFMRVRESHLQTVAALGAGLLIGSALAVIVPEGFHAFAHVSGRGRQHSGWQFEGVRRTSCPWPGRRRRLRLLYLGSAVRVP